MKRFFALSALAALALSLFPASSEAAREHFPKWYIGLNGSVNLLEATDLGTVPLPKTEYDNGFGAGASLGIELPKAWIQPLRGLSFEAEVKRYWQHIDNGRTDLAFPYSITSQEEREFRITSYMANAFYAFPFGLFSGVLRPYVGAGIGWADVEIEPDRNAITGSNYDDTVAALQGMAGFSFLADEASDLEWHVGYRYFITDEPVFDDGFGGRTEVDNRIYNLELGTRWRF